LINYRWAAAEKFTSRTAPSLAKPLRISNPSVGREILKVRLLPMMSRDRSRGPPSMGNRTRNEA
jgi:hypothetical protein